MASHPIDRGFGHFNHSDLADLGNAVGLVAVSNAVFMACTCSCARYPALGAAAFRFGFLFAHCDGAPRTLGSIHPGNGLGCFVLHFYGLVDRLHFVFFAVCSAAFATRFRGHRCKTDGGCGHLAGQSPRCILLSGLAFGQTRHGHGCHFELCPHRG